jgi:hypothetical protein
VKYSPYYPDDITGPQVCYIEGHIGKGRYPRCGAINYVLMGYYGAIARWAKAWGISEDEAEARIAANQEREWRRREDKEVGL